MQEDYEAEVKVFKALCNEFRLQVLARLRTGEKCACDLLQHVSTSQSNRSHHMKILVDSGIEVARQDGKWTHYSIDEEGAQRARDLLERITKSEGGQS
jgi:ArsR family transcriptional regulator